uniref:TRP C-terminal domain-containing protein n=1 Tax=Globisporangium ultimum (strain ATCC 200006 / CBS 805.95 / DAOM BR144) TaxID=431595 RepID=K3X009_GLOUD
MKRDNPDSKRSDHGKGSGDDNGNGVGSANLNANASANADVNSNVNANMNSNSSVNTNTITNVASIGQEKGKESESSSRLPAVGAVVAGELGSVPVDSSRATTQPVSVEQTEHVKPVQGNAVEAPSVDAAAHSTGNATSILATTSPGSTTSVANNNNSPLSTSGKKGGAAGNGKPSLVGSQLLVDSDALLAVPQDSSSNSAPTTTKKSPMTTQVVEAKQVEFNQKNEAGISKDANKAVMLGIDPQSTEAPEVYKRGQTSIQELNGYKPSPGGTGTSRRDQPVVIGGRPRNSSDAYGIKATASTARFYESIRYSASLACGVSMGLFILFHFAYFDPKSAWSKNAYWLPNSWEFILYIQYIQQTMSLSALTLLKTPYFLWEFTDTFSWTNFVVQGDASNSNSGAGSASRRLKTIVLDGLVGYSDRIGIDETKIMYLSIIGFAIIMGIVIAAFFTVTMVIKRLECVRNNQQLLQSIAVRICGLGVVVWYFSLFPLSLTASFEASMEIQANMYETWPLFFVATALFGVCSVGIAICSKTMLQKSERELRNFKVVAVYGVLYAECEHRARMFFILGASIQIVMGLCIGVFGSSSTLLTLLVAMQLLYLLAVVKIKPFSNCVVRFATWVLGALKLTNLGLAFAFLQSSKLSSVARIRVANAYLGINSLVIFLWFIRLLVVFCVCVAAWTTRKQEDIRPDRHQARQNEEAMIAAHELITRSIKKREKDFIGKFTVTDLSCIDDNDPEVLDHYTPSGSPAQFVTPASSTPQSKNRPWRHEPWDSKV